MSKSKSDRFDNLLSSPAIAAIVMRQPLKPVEGDDAVIYPPTFAPPKKGDPSVYNIDSLDEKDLSTSFNVSIDEKKRSLRLESAKDSTMPPNVCLIDSVGSQANRMEPLFKHEPYSELVPQIKIHIKTKEADETVHLFDAGHRIADAVARCTEMLDEINDAFLKVRSGDSELLARLAPTSLVFGVWDSRGTQVKLPRVVRSTIRALNVHKLTRSAQYTPALNYSKAGVLNEKEAEKGSEQGFSHVPAPAALGGVLLGDDSKVIREAVLSLSALRSLHAETDEMTLKLRRYILGLSLVMFTAPQEALLRMGCELTADPDNPATWEQVACTGERDTFVLSHDEALEYAKAAAKDFGVAEDRTVKFDVKKAKDSLKKK